MVSIDSVINNLADEQVRLLIMMQEGRKPDDYTIDVEWADEIWDAHEHIKKAIQSLRNAKENEEQGI